MDAVLNSYLLGRLNYSDIDRHADIIPENELGELLTPALYRMDLSIVYDILKQQEKYSQAVYTAEIEGIEDILLLSGRMAVVLGNHELAQVCLYLISAVTLILVGILFKFISSRGFIAERRSSQLGCGTFARSEIFDQQCSLYRV